ncbi:AAA family ATPase [Butyrivibrio sp. MC2013]|uniref:AAA family ATPase n=1 Tax=Butyrivibrio sp. MC2013 TaxID=1280686 RepID=UPI00041B7C66|nr:ATP-binding protein [Butyrivibrio sp. MC2013]
MKDLIGRENEIKRLDHAMEENEAQLIVVYGRRRVGKTYLINEYYDNRFTFKFTGSENQNNKEQLKNFILELTAAAHREYDQPKDWTEAFFALRSYLESADNSGKQVVFFDELPWMDKPGSGFLSAFEWFWNSWGAARKNLVFIVCGSATSWMVDKLDENKGGLFNRQTCRLFIEPFDLGHTEAYLQSRGINWSRYDIVQTYMIMGGIPFYLRLLDSSLTLNDNIDKLFFGKRAEMWNEFEHLYHTLFSNSDQYIKIAEALSQKKSGLSREEIVAKTGLKSNGVLTKMLSDLEKSGFIRVNNEYGHKKRGARYQLSDYYSLFYFRFIRDNYGKDSHFWANMNDNPARRAWAGLTFEQVCRDHIDQIKHALGISGVLTELSTWSKRGDDDEKGAQIDLIIERRDRVINLCEIKFSTGEYEIDKDYDLALKNKVEAFRTDSKCKMTIIMTMITSYGVKKNKYSNYIGREVTMEDLFD